MVLVSVAVVVGALPLYFSVAAGSIVIVHLLGVPASAGAGGVRRADGQTGGPSRGLGEQKKAHTTEDE